MRQIMLVIAVLVVSASAALAQETLPIAQLQAEIKPMRVESVGEAAELWMGLLQTAVVDEQTLILKSAEPGEAVTGEAIAKAEVRRNAIADRLRIIVDDYEAKGGDGEEYRLYIAQVGGSGVDWFNPKAVTGYISAWAVSPEGGIRLGLNIAKFIAIIIVGWIAARIASTLVGSAVKRLPKTSHLLQGFLVKLTRRVVLIVGLVVALGALGLNINPLIAAIGAAGLVIGLALQGTLSNLASGILILAYRPFDVGDAISAGGISGKVEAMNLVQTTILTFDNQIQFVPNNEIWNSVITNINGRKTRRVNMTFGIGYGDDIAKAEEIIGEIVSAHDKVLSDPAPVIKLHELADNSVNFIVRPWASTADYWDVYWDITKAIKLRFDAEEIGIPYPQRDLHIVEPVRVLISND